MNWLKWTAKYRMNIVLFQPEIPPNTGNIIRLCANTGCGLHLIKPLGFELTDKTLKRAGLDYHEYATIRYYENWPHFLQDNTAIRLFAFSTKGQNRYSDVQYQKNDFFLFGPETRGLPMDILTSLAPQHILRIPMQAPSRSLNLANTVAIAVYEAWRQLDFAP
jgi:tRNA (cytidine/uridine-2'-O-)-methyltransferase